MAEKQSLIKRITSVLVRPGRTHDYPSVSGSSNDTVIESVRAGLSPANAFKADATISPKEFYRGYGYGIVSRRGEYTANYIIDNIFVTNKDEDSELEHPYLKAIKESDDIDPFELLKNVSEDRDLFGFGIIGFWQDGLNFTAYNIDARNVRIQRDTKNEIIGITETRNGQFRDIDPKHYVLVRRTDRLSEGELSLAEAANTSSAALSRASAFTISAIDNNINAPGIIGTDMILPDNVAANFKRNVQAHTKGEPIFSNGANAVWWKDMQTDLNKAALDSVVKVNRDEMFSTLQTSKTIMNIEESGTTRDTARLQEGIFIKGPIYSQARAIVYALNRHYKKWHKVIYITSPRDLEIKKYISNDIEDQTERIKYVSDRADAALKLKQLKYIKEEIDPVLDGTSELKVTSFNDGEEESESDIKEVTEDTLSLRSTQFSLFSQLTQAGYPAQDVQDYLDGKKTLVELQAKLPVETPEQKQARILKEIGATDDEIADITGVQPEAN